MNWIKFSEQKPTKRVPCFVGTADGCTVLQWLGEVFTKLDGEIVELGPNVYWAYAVDSLPIRN